MPGPGPCRAACGRPAFPEGSARRGGSSRRLMSGGARRQPCRGAFHAASWRQYDSQRGQCRGLGRGRDLPCGQAGHRVPRRACLGAGRCRGYRDCLVPGTPANKVPPARRRGRCDPGAESDRQNTGVSGSGRAAPAPPQCRHAHQASPAPTVTAAASNMMPVGFQNLVTVVDLQRYI